MTALCQCGCGQPTKLARKTCVKRRQFKGQPLRFLHGHATKFMPNPEPYTVDPVTGCWNWNLHLDEAGYGRARTAGGSSTRAHRAEYEKKHGPIPQGLEPDHLCRNKRCVNPDHLEAVTHAENVRRSSHTVLTPGFVREIRVEHSQGKSQRKLAREYDVAESTIFNIVHGITWKDIGT